MTRQTISIMLILSFVSILQAFQFPPKHADPTFLRRVIASQTLPTEPLFARPTTIRSNTDNRDTCNATVNPKRTITLSGPYRGPAPGVVFTDTASLSLFKNAMVWDDIRIERARQGALAHFKTVFGLDLRRAKFDPARDQFTPRVESVFMK